jgi:hypothetical protein
MREIFLGDAVLAHYDGYNIRLRTSDGSNQRITLTPLACEQLLRMVAEVSDPRPRAVSAPDQP